MSLSSSFYKHTTFYKPIVKDTDWISESEATSGLGISKLRLELVITNQHLEGVKMHLNLEKHSGP